MKRSGLFFTELVLDLLIFALCAAVAVSLLVRARTMSRESAALNQAVSQAQSAAELWRSGQDIDAVLAQAAGGGLTVDVDDHGDNTADISVWAGDRLIYALEGVARFE